MNEELVWEGSPSQAVNLWTFVVCALTCVLIIPIFVALAAWLRVRSIKYQLTTQRLRVTYGVLSKRTEEVELYRVKDTSLVEPFTLRLFGLGNIEVDTSDPSEEDFVLIGLTDAAKLREKLRNLVEERRALRRVQEVEIGYLRR